MSTSRHDPPPKVQYMLQNSRNIFTNRKINNNALVVQVIQKSWAHYTQLSWVVRCTKTGAFSLNGHDISYIMSAKKLYSSFPL